MQTESTQQLQIKRKYIKTEYTDKNIKNALHFVKIVSTPAAFWHNAQGYATFLLRCVLFMMFPVAEWPDRLWLHTPEPQATCVIKHVATSVITPTTGPPAARLTADARPVGGFSRWVAGGSVGRWNFQCKSLATVHQRYRQDRQTTDR